MSGRDDALRVGELLCARMTHDLSGGVGVLGNLVELALERPEHAAESLTLASETASQLVLRLKLVRAAWGPETEAMPLDRLRDLARGLAQSRCVVDLNGLPPDTSFSAPIGRLVLNLLLLAAEGLPAGGEIGLTGSADDLVVAIAGPRAGWPAGLSASIADATAAWRLLDDPRKVQMSLCVLLAAQSHARMSLLLGPVANPAPPLRLQAAAPAG